MSNRDMWPEQPAPLEVIDFETKGNVFKLYLGHNGNQWGDDWNDVPYEHNAGRVYDEFVEGTAEFAVSFDSDVFEPSAGTINSNWSKQHMIARGIPCLVIVPAKDQTEAWVYTFEEALASPNAVKIYFGDKIDNVRKALANL